MKYTLYKFSMVLFISGTLFVSCGDGETKPEESKEVAEKVNDEKFKTDTSENKAQFVVDAVAGNIAEIKLAQLAQEKSGSKELKGIAKMLETEHTAALNDLKTLASSKSITIPVEETDKVKDQLKSLSEDKPADFDKDWTKQLMEKHEKTINDYEKELGQSTDDAVKAWINTVLPKIRVHHDKLMAYNSKITK